MLKTNMQKSRIKKQKLIIKSDTLYTIERRYRGDYLLRTVLDNKKQGDDWGCIYISFLGREYHMNFLVNDIEKMKEDLFNAIACKFDTNLQQTKLGFSIGDKALEITTFIRTSKEEAEKATKKVLSKIVSTFYEVREAREEYFKKVTPYLTRRLYESLGAIYFNHDVRGSEVDFYYLFEENYTAKIIKIKTHELDNAITAFDYYAKPYLPKDNVEILREFDFYEIYENGEEFVKFVRTHVIGIGKNYNSPACKVFKGTGLKSTILA